MENTRELLEFIGRFMPSLQEVLHKAKEMPERLDYHPEGNTYDHTLIVLGRAFYTGNKELIAAALFHDLGKVYTHVNKGLRNGVEIHSYPAHEMVSLGITSTYTAFIQTTLKADVEKTLGIIKYHMRMKGYIRGDLKKPAKREAIEQLTYYPELKIFSKMDNMLAPFYLDEDVNAYLV